MICNVLLDIPKLKVVYDILRWAITSAVDDAQKRRVQFVSVYVMFLMVTLVLRIILLIKHIYSASYLLFLDTAVILVVTATVALMSGMNVSKARYIRKMIGATVRHSGTPLIGDGRVTEFKGDGTIHVVWSHVGYERDYRLRDWLRFLRTREGYMLPVPNFLESSNSRVSTRLAKSFVVGLMLVCSIELLVYLFSLSTPSSVDNLWQEFYVNLTLFSLSTILPYFEIDRKTGTREVLGLGWKVWSIEFADVASLLVGYFAFARQSVSASPWHEIHVLLYFAVICVAVLGFASLTAFFTVAKLFRRTSDASCLLESEIDGPMGRQTLLFYFVIAVFLLDLATDAPQFCMSLLTGSYKGNLGFSLNMAINILAFARVLFLLCFKYASARELFKKNPQELSYIQIGL